MSADVFAAITGGDLLLSCFEVTTGGASDSSVVIDDFDGGGFRDSDLSEECYRIDVVNDVVDVDDADTNISAFIESADNTASLTELISANTTHASTVEPEVREIFSGMSDE